MGDVCEEWARDRWEKFEPVEDSAQSVCLHIGVDVLRKLKLVDEKDPSIAYVDQGDHFHLYLETAGVADVAAGLKANGVTLVKDVHETPWNTREMVIHDDQGHTLYFGQPV